MKIQKEELISSEHSDWKRRKLTPDFLEILDKIQEVRDALVREKIALNLLSLDSLALPQAEEASGSYPVAKDDIDGRLE
jgi:hypothetical protein